MEEAASQKHVLQLNMSLSTCMKEMENLQLDLRGYKYKIGRILFRHEGCVTQRPIAIICILQGLRRAVPNGLDFVKLEDIRNYFRKVGTIYV